MSENGIVNSDILIVNAEDFPEVRQSERDSIQELEKDFLSRYEKLTEGEQLEDWFADTLKAHLPEVSDEEIKEISTDILGSIRRNNEKLSSIQKAASRGIGKESWFSREMVSAANNYEQGVAAQESGQIASLAVSGASMASGQNSAKYLQNLDDAVRKANEALTDTITTGAGTVNMNPQLDGFIAEQYHAQTFNMNAEATGSPYRAEVLPLKGAAGKNSVDIVIKDANGKIVRRYQVKYCKDAKATEDAFKKGDYRGQQKLVPKDQNEKIDAKTTDHIEAPDGTSSNPLTKDKAKQMQKEAQSGEWNDLNWNEYKLQDIAVGIGKQAGRSALLGVGIGFGTSVVKQTIENHGVVDIKEASVSGLRSGGEFGLKAIIAGVIKVASEKGMITIVPKGTPAGTIANIVHVAVENVKVVSKMATGELTLEEGANEMEKVTLSTIAGIAAGAKGGMIGAEVGAFAGPVGVAVGGFIGASIGYMFGSGIAEKLVKTVQLFRKKVFNAVREEVELLADTLKYNAAERRKWIVSHPLLA